jgi:integrase
MSGTIKDADADLKNPTRRAKLKSKLKSGHARWSAISADPPVHLGYENRSGRFRWILRRALGKFKSKSGKEVYRYAITELGSDDDDGQEGGLSFDAAKKAAARALGLADGKQSKLTVREAMERYTAFKEAEGQPTRDLIVRTQAHILPALGNKLVAKLTADQLRRWLADLAASPAMVRSKRDAEEYNYRSEPTDKEAVRRRRSSANRVLTMLKAALNHAFDEGFVDSNKAWGRRVKPFGKVDAVRIRYLTVAEAKRLINACDPEFRPLVQAALQTGARYGELIALEVQDFNGDAGTVFIRKSKSGKPRHVILTAEGQSFFAQITAGRAGSERMFSRPDGSEWGKSDQARPMREACERAKISPPVGIHALRHTWASLSVMAGVPLMIVAKNLGHADTRMVEKHYGHLAPSYIVDAIRAGAPKFGFKPDKKLVPLKGR